MRRTFNRMWVKINRFSSTCMFVSLTLLVFYNEYLVYVLKTYTWPDLRCEPNCTRILFVADPQIIGERNETFPLPRLSRWDSDRYLSITFKLVAQNFKPHFVVFLGDIMDEGSMASDEEFKRYLRRIRSIFRLKNEVQYIFIPGDNDIGGEGSEMVSVNKFEYFKEMFGNSELERVGSIDLYKVNHIMNVMPTLSEQIQTEVSSTNRTIVVICHVPLLSSYSRFEFDVITRFKPAVIFSSHDHTSRYMKTNRSLYYWPFIINLDVSYQDVLHLEFDEEIVHEIVVPTCSYRMGVPNMGYGAAVFDNAGQILNYAVYWQPSRYKHLLLYLLFFVLSLTLMVKHIIYNCIPKRNNYMRLKVTQYDTAI